LSDCAVVFKTLIPLVPLTASSKIYFKKEVKNTGFTFYQA